MDYTSHVYTFSEIVEEFIQGLCQWQPYTIGRARSDDLAGRYTAFAPPCLLLCFGTVIV